MILIARHGETIWNSQGRMQGQLNSPLTERGIEQAELLSEIVDKLAITSIICSPLGRAVHTSKIVSARTDLPIKVDRRVQEVDFGKFAGCSEKRLRTRHRKFWLHREQNKWEYNWPGGESYADAFCRVNEFLLDHQDLDGTVVISHQSLNRMLIGKVIGLEKDVMLKLNQPSNVIFIIKDNRTYAKWPYHVLLNYI
jgi:probable phosphoglycerate mutase